MTTAGGDRERRAAGPQNGQDGAKLRLREASTPRERPRTRSAKNLCTGDQSAPRAVPCFPGRPRPALLILLVSDLHLGRGTPADTRSAERDAVAMLRAHENEILDGGGTLVLLGDVYNEYIEYRHLVPKYAPRLVGLLTEWCDRGARVVYVVGNRDPWHVDFFTETVGVETVTDAWETEMDGQTLYFAHGDGLRPAERRFAPLQPLIRSPLMARLFRMGLPGDSAFALARWSAKRLGTPGAPRAIVEAGLHDAARQRLGTTDADLVAFGHSHREALETSDDGVYLNPGYWFGARTFARIDADGPALFRWTDGQADRLADTPAARAPYADAPLS